MAQQGGPQKPVKVLEAGRKFDSYRFPQKSVKLLDHSPAVSYEQDGKFVDTLQDHTAFGHKFADELSNVGELSDAIEEADYFINTLYTYRSYSKPLPMIPADLSDNEKKPLYKKVFDILAPQVNKIKGLMEFHQRLIKLFLKNLRFLVHPFQKKEPLWQDHIRTLNIIIDKFFVLDALKDVKGQMKNDFARYKRAFSFTRSILENAGQLMGQITEIHNFLNDASHPNHVILYQLKTDIASVPHRENLLNILMQQAVKDLNNRLYVTPQEKHGLVRSIITCLYLADDKQANINVFKSKFINIKEIKKCIAKTPIIPVFMDTWTTTVGIIMLCDHWQPNMERDYLNTKTVNYNYDIVLKRHHIQDQYVAYTAELVTLLHTLRSLGKNTKIPMNIQQNGYNIVVNGMKLISDWCAKIKETVVWKANNPIDDARFKILGGQNSKYKVYEQITRFNYDNDIKYAMVEIIGLIKGLANLLLSNQTKLRSMLSQFMHNKLQDFTHNKLVWPLYRANKKKKAELLDQLVTIRLVASESLNMTNLRNDFKQKKEKDVKKTVAQHKWPDRKVFPTETQVLLLRRLLFHTFSEDSPGMKGGLFGGKSDLNKTEVKQFTELYKMLNYVKYVNAFQSTINNCSDLSDLWYREFYLNMTDCIQFPIAMSLPWMLTDFAMNTPSLAPNVFFPLSIYNDCANKALVTFRQQHLYDEIEAEVNLVFDQLIFTLYRKIFDYYKNKASMMLLDKTFQRKMESIRNVLGNQMKLTFARYAPVFQQKHISILGRDIDIQMLLTEQLNQFIRDNIDAIINRFDNSPITSIMEIEHLIRTLKLTVTMLRKELPGIDPFDDVFKEINDDTTLGSFRSRLFLSAYNKIFDELLRNYIFNQNTRRYVSLDRQRGSKRMDSALLWGSRFTQVYQQRFKVTRGFFGIEHLKSMVKLMGMDSMPLLVDETVKTVAHIVIRDISPYVAEILGALKPMKLADAFFGVLGVYGYYDLNLQDIRSYPALREGVFTLLREAGNALYFVLMLDHVLTVETFYNNQIKSFFMGAEPGDAPKYSNTIVYSSASIIMNKPQQSPFIKILKDSLEQLKEHSKNDKKGRKFINEQQFLQSNIHNAMKREQFLTGNSGGWLFSATLDYLYTNLKETGLLKKWKGDKPKNGILEHLDPKDFARFWSVSVFCFLVPDFNDDDVIDKRKQGYVDDRTYFGDGWLFAGATILYLTGLMHRYRLLDPTIYLDKLQRLYPVNLAQIKQSKKNKKLKNVKLDANTEAYKPFVRGLLNGWQEMEKDLDLILTILKSHYTIEQEPIIRFTPKWVDGNNK